MMPRPAGSHSSSSRRSAYASSPPARSCQVWQVIVSVKERKQNMDTTGDPWDGRTLEWATPSPVPFYNFAETPEADTPRCVLGNEERGEVAGGREAGGI